MERDIDDILADEFKLNFDEPDESEEEADELSDTTEEADENLETEEVTEEPEAEVTEEPKEETDKKPYKYTEEEKKEYNFKNLREENARLKDEQAKLTKQEEFLQDLAEKNGYTDIETFKSDLREAQLAKEAQEKGIDPRLYKETADLRKEVETLKQERQKQEVLSKAQLFRGAVEEAISEYELGEDGQQEIFSRLEDAGYTLDVLLGLPNPKVVVNGVLADIIRKTTVQKQIADIEKKSKVSDTRHDDSGSDEKFTLDDLIGKEIADYKKNNFY